MGTYLLGQTNESGKYILWGSDRKAIKTVKGEDFNKKSIQLDKAFSAYTLNGSGYFNFFAYLMLVTSVLFIPFAILLKEKVYLQASEE
jgi:Na+-transporting NADH:ubiquinone oxidoreductase subunit NqrC